MLLVVCGSDARGLVANNDLDVLVLGLLFEVLELEFSKKGLNNDSSAYEGAVMYVIYKLGSDVHGDRSRVDEAAAIIERKR